MIKYLLIFLLITGTANAQTFPGSFLSPNSGARGVTYNGLKALRELYLPQYDTTYTPSWEGAIVFRMDDQTPYIYRGGKWQIVGGFYTDSAAKAANKPYTIAALRLAYTVTGLSYISTDYGGGTWIDKGVNDGSHTDNTGTILTTANNHWLERQFNSEYKAEWFGIKADGTTNNDASFPLLSSLQGIITFPLGVIGVNNFVSPGSNQTWRGQGKDKTIIKLLVGENGSSNGNFVVKIHAKQNVGMEEMTIDGNGTAQNVLVNQTSCLEISGSSRYIRLKSIKFNDARTGPGFSGGYGIVSWAGNGGTGEGGGDDVLLEGIEFNKIGQSDLGLFDGFRWVVSNAISRNTGYSCINVETELHSRGIKNVTISNWVGVNIGRMPVSLIRNVNTGPVEDVRISNCVFDSCSLINDDIGAIRIRGTDRSYVDGVTINNCRGTGIRLTVDSQFPVNDASLSNIVIHKAGLYGVLVQGDSINQVNNLYMNNVKVDTCTSLAYNIAYCNNLTINNPFISNSAGGVGMIIKNVVNGKLLGGSITKPSTYGVQFRDATHIAVKGISILNADYAGFYLTGQTDYISIEGTSVRDDRVSKSSQYGFYATSDLTTTSPTISITGNDFANNASIPISIAAGIDKSNIIRLMNNTDVYKAINNLDAQTISGQITNSSDGTFSPVIIRSTATSGGYIDYINLKNTLGWRYGLTGDTTGDVNIYNKSSGLISLRINKTTEHVTLAGSISGAAAVNGGDYITLSQLNAGKIDGAYLYLGKASVGGGAVRLLNDAGTQKWLVGHLGSAGYNHFDIYDLTHSVSRFHIDSATGAITLTGTTTGLAATAANQYVIRQQVTDTLTKRIDSLNSAIRADFIKTGIAFFSGDGSTTTFDIVLPTTPSWANAETSSAAGANITYRAPITNGIRIFYAVAPPVGTNNISISYQYK